jgi:hypothetical protein
MRILASDWTPWYVDLGDGRVRCRICGDDFTKKNGRMLSHLMYIPKSGARDIDVKLCKNMKPDVLRAFRGCGGVTPVPPEPAESQHHQGSAESEEPICLGSQSSTMYASCGASQNLAAACGPFGILQVLLYRYSHLRGRLVYGHFNKAPFRCCMPRSNDASVTWLGLNSFIIQTFHLLQLDQQASKQR